MVFYFFFQSFTPFAYNKAAPFHDFFSSILKSLGILYQIFHCSVFQIVFVSVIYALLAYKVIRKDIIQESNLEKTNEGYKRQADITTRILDSINYVVGEKKKRFSQCADSIAQKKDDGAIFREITQPESQIMCILTHISFCFRNIFDDTSILAYIFYVKDGKVSQTKLRCSKQTVDISYILNNTHIQNCINTRTTIVATDCSGKRKNYQFNPSGIGFIKSAICYPIIDNSKMTHVILVTSEKNLFKEKEKTAYELILEEFATRINLEEELNRCLEKKNG